MSDRYKISAGIVISFFFIFSSALICIFLSRNFSQARKHVTENSFVGNFTLIQSISQKYFDTNSSNSENATISVLDIVDIANHANCSILDDQYSPHVLNTWPGTDRGIFVKGKTFGMLCRFTLCNKDTRIDYPQYLIEFCSLYENQVCCKYEIKAIPHRACKEIIKDTCWCPDYLGKYDQNPNEDDMLIGREYQLIEEIPSYNITHYNNRTICKKRIPAIFFITENECKKAFGSTASSVYCWGYVCLQTSSCPKMKYPLFNTDVSISSRQCFGTEQKKDYRPSKEFVHKLSKEKSSRYNHGCDGEVGKHGDIYIEEKFNSSKDFYRKTPILDMVIEEIDNKILNNTSLHYSSFMNDPLYIIHHGDFIWNTSNPKCIEGFRKFLHRIAFNGDYYIAISREKTIRIQNYVNTCFAIIMCIAAVFLFFSRMQMIKLVIILHVASIFFNLASYILFALSFDDDLYADLKFYHNENCFVDRDIKECFNVVHHGYSSYRNDMINTARNLLITNILSLLVLLMIQLRK